MTKQTRLQNGLALMTGVVLSLGLLLPGVVVARQDDKQRGRPAEVTERINERIEERRSASRALIEEKRESRQEKSTEARVAACERRLTKITSAMSRISTQATKHVETFDKIYERVQGFYENGQLTVENYDDLNAAAAEAQAAATLEASILSELNVEVDCTNPDVASTVATYRDSTQAAKEALKTYRSTLVELVSSLKAEASQQNETETEESNDSPEDTAETETETEESNNDSDDTTEAEDETSPTEAEEVN